MTERDTWPEPDLRLVEDDRPPASMLADDALPGSWGEWIAADAEARGCPRDYVAAALIASASAWIGNARHVAATPTFCEPPHLWFALVGPPSTGKTPALSPFVAASRAIEREAEPAWQIEKAEHAACAEAAVCSMKNGARLPRQQRRRVSQCRSARPRQMRRHHRLARAC